jgi:nicotinamidase-related amidase
MTDAEFRYGTSRYVAEREKRYGAAIASYAERGFGGRIGGGSWPAFVVVDMAKAFTNPQQQLGWDLDLVLTRIREILDVMRAKGMPVIFLTVALEPGMMNTVALQKTPATKSLLLGSELVEIDDRLGRRDNEPVLVKQYYSSFFGTSLSSLLTNFGVDTVLIGGTSTSGCVRATAMDAIALGFRPLVVEECCGDRNVAAHEANLFDIDMKYGDVISHAQALEYLESIPARKAA